MASSKSIAWFNNSDGLPPLVIQKLNNNFDFVKSIFSNENIVTITEIIEHDYQVPPATSSSIGGIIVSNGLGIDGSGHLWVDLGNSPYGVLPIESGGTGADNSADALDNLGAAPYQDSGWQSLENVNNTQVGMYRKLMGVVYLRVQIGASENINVDSSGTQLGTLPSGFLPSALGPTETVFPAISDGTENAALSIGANGEVTAYRYGAGGVEFAAYAVFPADN